MVAKAQLICHLTLCGSSGFLLSVLNCISYSYLRLFQARLVGDASPLVWCVLAAWLTDSASRQTRGKESPDNRFVEDAKLIYRAWFALTQSKDRYLKSAKCLKVRGYEAMISGVKFLVLV